MLATLLFYFLFLFYSPKKNVESPLACQGVIDLTSWDFEKDGIVSLRGEWEYYDEQLLAPEDFDKDSNQLPQFTEYSIPLSGRENLSNRVGYREKGYGTYHLVLNINPNDDYYSVKIMNNKNYTTNKLFVNGERLRFSGDIEDRKINRQISEESYPMFFKNSAEQIEIILQVSNFYRPFSLDEYNIAFARQVDFQMQETISVAIELSGVALCFGIALYYLCLYFGKSKDKEIPYLILEFISLSLLFLFSGEMFNSNFFPGTSMEFIIKMNKIALFSITYSIAGLTNTLSKNVISDKTLKIIKVGFIIIAITLLFTPYQISKYILQSLYAPILIIHLYMVLKPIYIIFKEKLKHDVRNSMVLNVIFIICILITTNNNNLFGWGIVSSKVIGYIAMISLIILSQLFLAFKFIVNQNRLTEIEKAKDDFFVKSSYILKAPLNSILKVSESIIHYKDDYTAGKEVITDKAKVIKSITNDLLNSVNGILDATLLQNNQLKLYKSPLDMKICIELIVNNIKKLEFCSGIDIIVDVSEGLIVMGDEARIRQIIHNLIYNGIYSMSSSQQYTSENQYNHQKVITIKGREKRGRIYIRVIDQGCGISKQQQKEIFKPYVTYNSEGIGLGLYISSLLAQNMDAILRLEWSESGKGSSFVLEFPSSKEEYALDINNKEVSEDYAGECTLPIYHGGINKAEAKTILIVDDELFNVRAAANILASEGYNIASAYSGNKALEIIDTIKIDLVILDIMMLGISGIEICKSIRKKYSLIELPIILTSSVSVNNDLKLGLQAEANDLIIKPFIDNELRVRVKTLIALKTSIEDATKSEFAFLQAQIKPHFIYNTINTIISFCYTDSERAASFSHYLRLTFDIDNINMFIPIRREIELIKAYVEIQNARFTNRFKVEYNIDPLLLENKIPSLIIQPLVENAIKHGFCKSEDIGIIDITIKEAYDKLIIIVKDTGIGMEAEIVDKLNNMEYKTDGVGIWNIKKRISKIKSGTMFIDSIENMGTTVTMTMILQ